MPFNGLNILALSKAIVNDSESIDKEPLKQYSKSGVRALIKGMLKPNHIDRPNINQILKHPDLKKKARELLPDAIYQEEFAHTRLHGHDIFQNNKQQEQKIQETIT